MEQAEISLAGDVNDQGIVPQETKAPTGPILHPLKEEIISNQEALLAGEAFAGDLEKGDSTFELEGARLSKEPRAAYLSEGENGYEEVQVLTEPAQVGLEGKGNSHEEFQLPQTPLSTYPNEMFYSQSEADVKELHQTTLTPKTTPLFRQAKISIAVDVSGSTYGNVIEAEVKAIRSICSLFPSSLRSAIKILPWSNVTGYPVSIDELDDLDPDGDTDPSSLLHDDVSRYELQTSSFWFLMTDGDIFENEVRNFSQSLVEYGLHGLASVIAIFGERDSTPSRCNISVGLSVFAVSPHCAFLYTDVETGKTYILQTKGCFSALLPRGRSNPRLDRSTVWTDLPQTSYENLARVPIPPPQAVSKDEVVLKDNSRLNLSNLLLSPSVDPHIASRILDHEDNIKTIALTAKLKGQSEQFRKWLDNVEKINQETLHPDKIERPETNEGSDLLTEAIANLMKAEEPNKHTDQLQKRLRESNSRSLQQLDDRVLTAQVTSHRRSSSGTHARHISSSSLSIAEDNIGSISYDMPLPTRQQYSGLGRFDSPGNRRLATIPQTPGVIGYTPKTTLFNPGFNKPDLQKDYYKGTCMLCASDEPVMALLLKKPPKNQAPTADFPLANSSSNLRYPLTVGNYPETDIIAPLMACDPCSYQIARKGRMPSGEEISAALPLLSFTKNQTAWLETINRATQKRFSADDLLQVFIAILYTKLERLLGERDSRVDLSLRPALSWCCNTLLNEVQLLESISTGTVPLHKYILKMFQNTLSTIDFMDLLTYPIDGFIVANVALSASHHKNNITAVKRQRLVFYRFLYHLTEQYIKLSVESGEMVQQATMMLLLVLDEQAAPRSLLSLEAVRQFSVHFKNRQEMMQTLKSHLNWQPRKYKPKRLSISVKDLLDTPFLDARSLRDFQRLGTLFTWIEDKAAHAIAVFLHYLNGVEKTEGGASELFVAIRKRPEMGGAMSSPEEMSAKKVEDLIKEFTLLS